MGAVGDAGRAASVQDVCTVEVPNESTGGWCPSFDFRGDHETLFVESNPLRNENFSCMDVVSMLLNKDRMPRRNA